MIRQDSASRRPITEAMLPVHGEVLEAVGDLDEISSCVTSLFKEYADMGNVSNDLDKDIRVSRLRREESKADLSEYELFMELIYDIQHELNVERLCFKILHNIAVLTSCDRSSLFLTRKEGDQSFLVCKLFDLTSHSLYEEVCQSEENTFVIPFGKGVLGHVAQSKEFVKINNAYEDKRFNPAIDYKTGYRTYSILCMPIIDSSSNVVGVAQIINKSTGEKDNIESHMFSDQDILVFKKYLMFCGIGITNAQLFQLSMQEYKCNRLLLTLARSIFCENTKIEKLIEQIMINSLEIVDCERCYVLLCDSITERSSSLASEFMLSGGKVRATKISRNQENKELEGNESKLHIAVAEHSLKTGQTFVARNHCDLEEKAAAFLGISINKEEVTRNIICTPIKNAQGEILAVGQMVNKRNGVFSTSDIAAFEGFVIYCGLGIQNTYLYQNIHRMSNFQKVCLDMLSYHATAREDELPHIQPDTLDKDLKLQLTTSEGITLEKLSDVEVVAAIVHMYHRLALVQTYNIDQKTLVQWIYSVKKNYRSVEFHNWKHAVTVAQTMFWLLLQPDISAPLTQLDKLCLLSSCLCHDMDHRGTNNAFQQKSKSPLAALHNSSTMEHHHFNIAIMILNTAGNNILESLPEDDYRRAITLLKHCILSTDLALHFLNRDVWKDGILDKLPDVDFSTDENKFSLMSMLMTASDLGACTKSWEVQVETAVHVAEEFYQQGDLERFELHSTPTATMDRQNKHKFPEVQVAFFDSISIPLYTNLSQAFKSVDELKQKCESNRENWQKLKEQTNKEQEANKNNELSDDDDDDDDTSTASVYPGLASDEFEQRLKELQSPIHRKKISHTNSSLKSADCETCGCVIS